MGIYFFDTSALKHRYIASPYARQIRRVISGRRYQHYITDLTVIEIASALGSWWRNSGLGLRRHDVMDAKFFRDVAAGRLIVRPTSQRDAIRARRLLRFAGVIKKRNLGAADALIASSCLALAQERKTKVVFYTADWTLYSILRDIDAFRAVMSLRFVGVPRAGIPGRTG